MKPAAVPAYQPITDEEAVAIVREASRGAATRRDGTTSTRIVRATESAVLARVASSSAVPAYQPMTDEDIESTAHRMATRYIHGSSNPHDSSKASYAFNRTTLLDFVRAVLARVAAAPAAVQPVAQEWDGCPNPKE